MAHYVIRRLILCIPVLLLVTMGVFLLIHLAPGDPLFAILGEDQGDSEVVNELRRRMGLDQPIPLQYVHWLGNVVTGDLGYSYAMRESVSRALLQRLPVTLQLAVVAVFFSTIAALGLGIISAVYRGSWLDLLAGVFAAVGASMPDFWLGLLLILAFAVKLGILPPLGYVSPTTDAVGNIKSIILPTLTLGLGYLAVLSRLVRASLLEALHQDYIMVARSKGLKNYTVILRHGVRNALIPVITIVSSHIGRLLGGAAVVETIFALPGIGQLAVNSVLSRDFPMIQAVVLLMAVGMVVSNLLADILYAVVDPRIRYS